MEDQANTGALSLVMLVPPLSRGKNKADITWMTSASASLSPSAKPVPRLLVPW